MKGVIAHWTGGSYKANATDKKSYHRLVEGDGKVISGFYPISANKSPIRGSKYAAHCFNNNSDMIGVGMCCMGLAEEMPYNPGPYPMKQIQWDAMVTEIAALCKKYRIPVTLKTVMSHAEVGVNLGIRQKNKWDFTVLPWMPGLRGARPIGDKLRQDVRAAMIDKVITEPRNTKLAIAGAGGATAGIGATIVGASQDAQEFIWGVAPITDTVSAMSNRAATVVGAATALAILGVILMAVWKWARKE